MIETIQSYAIFFFLAICSLAALAVFLERMMVLKKADMDSDALLLKLRQPLQEGDLVEAIRYCQEQPGPVSNIIKAGLMRHDLGMDRVEAAMESSGRLEIAGLERGARLLAIISHVAPLLGLLGTVVGFIEAFGQMRASGLVDITSSHLGAALEYALMTTAVGLAVAIPSLMGYHYIVSRVESFVLEIQTVASEVVEILLFPADELAHGGMRHSKSYEETAKGRGHRKKGYP